MSNQLKLIKLAKETMQTAFDIKDARINELEADKALLREALEAKGWNVITVKGKLYQQCGWCGAYWPYGEDDIHYPDCLRQRALGLSGQDIQTTERQ